MPPSAPPPRRGTWFRAPLFATDLSFEQSYAEALAQHNPLAYLTLLDPEVTPLRKGQHSVA
jgi:hypothetical protein